MKLSHIEVSNPYLSLPSLCYEAAKPTPLKSPYLIHANEEVAEILEIDRDELATERFVRLLNGEWFFKGAKPFAMAYAGHQFGYFVPQLGDGRAVNIGTIGTWHLQLKGAGMTAYSRSGDGRAVLRSSIREYLMSEAMRALGIPTTRALGILGSEHSVYRDDWEKGAMVLRVSESWVRFGTFEYAAHRGDTDALRALAAYVVAESYPHLQEETDEEERYASMLCETIERTARLTAQWQAVGFSHGVMNTDNMSIAGLTIDYGPYGFLDAYDKDYVCNRSDTHGRYRFGAQPAVAEWNLRTLAKALEALIPQSRSEACLARYFPIYKQAYGAHMRAKLGLQSEREEDATLISDLLDTMQKLQIDYTYFFRALSRYEGRRDDLLKAALYHRPMHAWLDRYEKRLSYESRSDEARREAMLRINPAYVLKNHMLADAIEAAEKKDFALFDALFRIAKAPFEEHEGFEAWAQPTPQDRRNTRLSCSS